MAFRGWWSPYSAFPFGPYPLKPDDVTDLDRTDWEPEMACTVRLFFRSLRPDSSLLGLLGLS
jgi:hypothetical protein